VGVEPTGDRSACHPPVLKTGTITGPHALPCAAPQNGSSVAVSAGKSVVGNFEDPRERRFALDRWCPMAYNRIVETVVETPGFLSAAAKLFTDEERADIVNLLAVDPEAGDVIRGTGGFRKVRVARRGMGKSGGARVIYIFRSTAFPVFLVTVFSKNQKENLSANERNELKKRADQIFATYRFSSLRGKGRA